MSPTKDTQISPEHLRTFPDDPLSGNRKYPTELCRFGFLTAGVVSQPDTDLSFAPLLWSIDD